MRPHRMKTPALRTPALLLASALLLALTTSATAQERRTPSASGATRAPTRGARGIPRSTRSMPRTLAISRSRGSGAPTTSGPASTSR